MMRAQIKSLTNLEHLREGLSKQAQIALGSAEKKLQRSEETLQGLQSYMTDCTSGETTAAVLQLCEAATLAAALALESDTAERNARKAEATAKAIEHKQIEKVVEKRQERALREGEKREQRVIDDWTSSQRGRR